MRPIGVGEVIRRVIGKCVTKVTKQEIVNACSSLQVCAGLTSGGKVAIHNTRILCPSISIYAINTYREPARLFVIGGKELTSAEGTTQSDNMAMSLCAISFQPLITRLNSSSLTKQCWYADDAAGAGPLKWDLA